MYHKLNKNEKENAKSTLKGYHSFEAKWKNKTNELRSEKFLCGIETILNKRKKNSFLSMMMTTYSTKHRIKIFYF